MIRQSVSLTTPNNDWLNAMVASEEYSSKSEILNDLLRRERERQEKISHIREALIVGENSGISTLNKEEMREKFKEELRVNGKI